MNNKTKQEFFERKAASTEDFNNDPTDEVDNDPTAGFGTSPSD